MTFLDISPGDSPLVLSMPHTGTELPDGFGDGLNAHGQALADTDWHIHDLYGGLAPGATRIRTRVHRYVVDVNRDPTDKSLYPGQNTTGLVPLTDFDGRPIWTVPPGEDEIRSRTRAFHRPYHDALHAELDRVSKRHGFAILFDCHSIRSRIPFLFDDVLPNFNIGTNSGTSCAPEIEAGVLATCQSAQGFTTVLNGRFKGGWTTRHYGRPEAGWHAVQMELAQSTYLSAEAPPWHYDASRATSLRAVLSRILDDLTDWTPR